jgi:hypothetical protein
VVTNSANVGHSRPNLAVRVMSGLPPLATVGADIAVQQLRANHGLSHFVDVM